MKKMIFTAEIWKEGNMFTSYCPELDVARVTRKKFGLEKHHYKTRTLAI